MKRFALMLLAGITIAAAIYLLIPIPGFPPPPPGSLISYEPADTESIYRKSYYTDLSRDQIMAFYKSQFKKPFIRLNHPPEEAQSLIRDQARSSWLEELVHPGKDLEYINGFYPTKATEQINLNKVHYQGKITVHYFPYSRATSLTVLVLSVVCIILLIQEYDHI